MSESVPTATAPYWINHLQPAQLALARTIQQNGLVGQPVDLAGFAWLLDGEVLVTSGQRASLSDAFDVAVEQLPPQYIQPPF
ncbi:hypothetical protein QOL99_01780 [Deinococcus sp. MIMF12]|uniref:Uncharacterized protein n=1 Tax=Deinococcus rhizophilus TaxID=3049544 RepID=A0ABT7JCU5_9DEIO|nr:hypothetical protein [Deinococcus rhizophilus]MDL2342871.1 hypothetical protein [Deinococcus rhizophilus]